MRVLAWDIGTKTLSYCLLQFEQTPGEAPNLTILEWETVNVHEEAGLSAKAKPTMREDAEYVIKAIHRRCENLWNNELDYVVVEQQPAGGKNMFSSVRMKILSHVVHAYFYIFQVFRADSVTVPVQFVSPSSKLVGMETGETQDEAEARRAGDRKTMGAKYRANKRHAVDMTVKLLETMQGDPAHRARLIFAQATPKQDDVADAFMLAYAFCVKQSKANAPKKRKRTTDKSEVVASTEIC